METRIKVHIIKETTDKIFGDWSYYSNHQSHYNGRILIVWRQDWYDVVVQYNTTQVVTCLVKYIPLQIGFIATFVYDFNQRDERVELWDHLRMIHQGYSMPWIILGNFILHSEDKVGENPITPTEVVNF